MGLRKFFKKVGKAAKKVLPYAALAAPFIPGVGGAISSGLRGVSGLFSAKDSAQDAFVGPMPEGAQPPVQVTGQREPFDWQGMMKSAMPLIQGGMQMYGQSATNAANAQQAQKQMDFQADQTGTSYQRGVADMKAAGLNPMLAYSQGGASSGAGASAIMGNEVGAAASSALQATQTMQSIDNMRAQERNIDAQTANTDMDTINKGLDQPYLKNRGDSTKWDYQLKREDLNRAQLANYLTNNIMESQISSAKATAGHAQNVEKSSRYGLSKDAAQSNYYQDKNWGFGGYYEGQRNAVQSNAASAGKAARDIKALAVPWGY